MPDISVYNPRFLFENSEFKKIANKQSLNEFKELKINADSRVAFKGYAVQSVFRCIKFYDSQNNSFRFNVVLNITYCISTN